MSDTLETPIAPTSMTVEEALSKVDELSEIPIKNADQPYIEAQAMSLTYMVNFDTNFEDRNAYVTGISKFMEEATVHSELNELLEEGKKFASMLYTWRSCSRAAPSVKANQENRMEIYEKLIGVLEPEISKLIDFMKFQKDAITRFCDEVKKLTHQAKRNDFVSESYLLTLGKLLNMFAVLDALKNMKASIRNDLAQYKRAKQSVKKANESTGIDDSHTTLTMFLAQHDEITKSVKKTLETIPGYEDLMADIINICTYHYEDKMYLLPSEKHMLLKVMGFSLFLLDGATTNIYKMEAKKKLNLSKIDKFFKNLPVVPLYGDMQIVLFTYIQNGANFEDNKSRWSCGSSSAGVQYNIADQLPRISAEHTRIISDLVASSSQLLVPGKKPGEISSSHKTQLYDLALRGLKLLESWTSLVMELFSWKLVHPVSDTLCPEKEAEEYERATRYNYTKEEKFALVQVIALIKGLQHQMYMMENIFTSAIDSTIYSEIQEYAQMTLREPLRIATKKKKTLVLSILRAVRDTSADWLQGAEPQDDPALRGEKDPKTGYQIKRKNRNVATSSTQLYMTRTMSESLIADRSLGGKKTMRKEIDGATLDAISTFHKRSFFYKHLSHFSEALQECGDLSQFWYREFFLEMTMGKRIQFPIEMSMPWILTDNILQSKDSSMMEYMFYPLDLYNDSAHYAMTHFKKQFLYDEVEAEVNLCFDQFVYKLSDQIFAFYKQQAGCMLLNKGFQRECQRLLANIPQFENLLSIEGKHQLSNRYESLLKQRHVQLLGRTVDFNKLITQRIQVAMQKSLDLAISKFESSDITSIIELETLLEVNRLTHKLLSDHMTLASYDVMFQEANHTVQAPYGRITLHLFWELNCVFLPQYCYNAATNRFVRASEDALLLSGGRAAEQTREKIPSAKSHFFFGSKVLNQAFSRMMHVYSNFVGQPHFQAMARLLDYGGIAVIIKETLQTTKALIQGELLQYVKILMEAMPKLCGQPMYDYGVEGVFRFYEAKLLPIIQYTDMRTEVFQRFRILGNTILFCQQLEQNLTQEELRGLLLSGPFRKILPKAPVKEGEKPDTAAKKLEKNYACMNAIPIVDKHGTKEQSKTIKEGAILTKERLCVGLSMFQVVLKKIASCLDDPVWDGRNSPPANGVMCVEECVEFYRLWSAIQFLMCWTVGKNEITVEECFGEGLTWAGCTLMVLLQQHYRFQQFDFSYHLANVYDATHVKKQVNEIPGVDIKRFMRRIERFQLLNNQIFGVVSRYLHGTGQDKFIPLKNVKHLEAPQSPEVE